tara:strand:- start:1031 stop:1417 length:387 start_codon:yes stop_codon:yes gene_type:complete
MDYGYQRIVELAFENVNKKLRESLMNEGFGIITEIDVQKTFKEKLDIDYDHFQILGACNPILAKEVLDHEREVAMFLPCNVIFWKNKDSSVTISAVDAEKQLSFTNNEKLLFIGREVNRLLINAVDSI